MPENPSSTDAGLRGILPAVVTPLDIEGRFNEEAFEKLLGFVYSAGVDGVYVCGQTGEGLQLPATERMRAAEAAVRLSPPGKKVVVHAGANSTAQAIELVKHAASVGVHAVSSLPPLGGHSFEEIRGYYEILAEASEVPLLVYYFPDLCPAISELDRAIELASLPNVIGLKFTDYNLFNLWRLKQQGAVVFNGRDEVLAAGLLMGADGGIGSFYNLVPSWFVEVQRLGAAGRWEEARAVQRKICALIHLVLRFPGIGAIKTMLGWMGIDCGPCVAPRATLGPVQESRLREMLVSAGMPELARAQSAHR